MPLIAESPAHDLLLVQIKPSRRDALLTTPQDIVDRLNEITFNSSLIKELRSLVLIKQMLLQKRAGALAEDRAPLFKQIAALRMHRIDSHTWGDAPPWIWHIT